MLCKKIFRFVKIFSFSDGIKWWYDTVNFLKFQFQLSIKKFPFPSFAKYHSEKECWLEGT